MKLALMQPYFFPYIGYWQLMYASDMFVLLDDVQFIRGGWIERNRILNPHGGWQYMSVPLRKHSHKDPVRSVMVHGGDDWKRKVLAQLAHYRRKGPFFAETYALISDLLARVKADSICGVNASLVRGISKALGLSCDIRIASECGFDYSGVLGAGDWALRISEQCGATEYINPAGGAHLFDTASFAQAGIILQFLQPQPVEYDRGGEFIAALSIVDVMMFAGIGGAASLLPCFDLKGAGQLT